MITTILLQYPRRRRKPRTIAQLQPPCTTTSNVIKDMSQAPKAQRLQRRQRNEDWRPRAERHFAQRHSKVTNTTCRSLEDEQYEIRSERQHRRRAARLEFQERWKEFRRKQCASRTGKHTDDEQRILNHHDDKISLGIPLANFSSEARVAVVRHPTSTQELQPKEDLKHRIAETQANSQGKGFGVSVDWMTNLLRAIPIDATVHNLNNVRNWQPTSQCSAVLLDGHWSLVVGQTGDWTHVDSLTRSKQTVQRHRRLQATSNEQLKPLYAGSQPKGTTQCGYFVLGWVQLFHLLPDKPVSEIINCMTFEDTVRLRALHPHSSSCLSAMGGEGREGDESEDSGEGDRAIHPFFLVAGQL